MKRAYLQRKSATMISQIFSLEGRIAPVTCCTSGIGRTISLCHTKGSAVGTATKCWIEGDSSLGEIKADALSLTLDGLRKVHQLAKRARTAQYGLSLRSRDTRAPFVSASITKNQARRTIVPVRAMPRVPACGHSRII